ncbi:MAG: hypothetical protein A2826_01615 [Candidatus Doudnabacteria bacterium RIFCSPHIGHO2_01_FULL_43_23]|uniref:Uncharacterized protein n=1 Tax=Candidatus Doudnabacteria bacterium RIFCSPHIGHO2_01_FULL_43_23 TaxID=1817822 RepID=A0A1F5NS74_9BACT|nr:MAG: hypothetical protein A2826_01615 [Candidatus Doudnabacteria bacterium RIFCSPHIGHO2_01_FULL_43_23]
MSKFILVGGPVIGGLAFLIFGVIIALSATPLATKIWASTIDFVLAISFFFWAWSWAKNPPGAEAQGLKDQDGEILKTTGKKVIAEIFNIKHIANIRVNGRAPYIIFAKATNVSGNSQVYSSALIWSDPNFILANRKDKQVTIFVDPSNSIRYYMDLPSIGVEGQT